jgi:TatD DNase family protein
MPWVYHGFGSSPQMAKQMNSRHIYISLGSKVLKDIPKTNKLIRELDINFLLVETDESDTGIKEIYRYVARRRGISIEELIRIVHRNFQQVFKA